MSQPCYWAKSIVLMKSLWSSTVSVSSTNLHFWKLLALCLIGDLITASFHREKDRKGHLKINKSCQKGTLSDGECATPIKNEENVQSCLAYFWEACACLSWWLQGIMVKHWHLQTNSCASISLLKSQFCSGHGEIRSNESSSNLVHISINSSLKLVQTSLLRYDIGRLPLLRRFTYKLYEGTALEKNRFHIQLYKHSIYFKKRQQNKQKNPKPILPFRFI